MSDTPFPTLADSLRIESAAAVTPPDLSVSTDALVDILRRRGITTVYYFHTDHYEPWSSTINDKSARAVERFANMSRRSRFGRKQSLFYAPFVPYDLDLPRSKRAWRVGEDAVVFLHRTPDQERLAGEVIGSLFAGAEHEPHMHVHHEFWTRNESHFLKAVSQWVNAHSTAQMDSNRLDLFFRLCKEVIVRELGAPFERWAFIHGNWALAASDPLICTIENELPLIMRHGGFGDFSFPAGRSYCDPKVELPFTCRPIEGRRVYDDLAADPSSIAFGGKRLSDPGRFFIWNSAIKAVYSSLDYYTSANRDLLRDPARVLSQWLENSVVFEDALFIKTHAHSMKWEYDIADADSLIPHCYPDVVTLFEQLLRVCDRAGAAFELITVNELMSILHRYDAGLPPGEQSTDAVGWAGEPDLGFSHGDAAPSNPAPSAVKVPLSASDGLASAASNTGKPAAGDVRGTATSAVDSTADSGQATRSLPLDVAAFTVEFLAHQRAWSKGNGSLLGPDDLFAAKLSRGIALEPYEVAVAGRILNLYDHDTKITEIGVGYGALALYLARHGYFVEGYDGDRRRAAAATWHIARYIASYPRLNGHIEVVAEYFPTTLPRTISSADRRLAIATNVTCTYTASNHDAIFTALVRDFDEVVLDLARFGRNRNSQIERDDLRAALQARGFQPLERLYVGNPNEYWRFAVDPKARRRAATSDSALEPVVPQSSSTTPAASRSGQLVASLPLSTPDSGVLFSVYGDRYMDACPVCHGSSTVLLWRMPMANLKESISLFGGYFDQVPTMQVPATVYCFDFCHECESIFLNPVPASQKEQYRKTDDYIRTMQADSLWRQYESAFDRIAKWIPLRASVLMDAVCGIGPYLEIARRREPQRWRRLVGLELSEKYVEHMRARALEAYAFDIDNDDLVKLLNRDSVDFIVFSEAFEHVERPLHALGKLLTVLKPGGRLYFTAPRYGRDVQATVRSGEPIYIGEKVLKELPERLGCKVLDASRDAMRYYVVLEK